MNLRHIEVFHAVYTQGSVSGAARMLNVSQPSVTKVLRHAEAQLGFDLFTRARGRLVPTEEAHGLIDEVSQIQERLQSVRAYSRNLRSGAGQLRVSALPSLGLGVLPEAVARYRRQNEAVTFDLQTVHHDDLLRKLYERECDVAIAFEVPHGAPVASHWLGEGELVLLYREEDMPDAAPRLQLKDLEGRPFISLAQSGPIGHLFTREAERLEIALDEVVSARTFYIAGALVRSGAGVAVVDSFTAQAFVSDEISSRPLRPSLAFDVFAVHLESRPPSRLLQDFLTELRDTIDRL